MTAPVWMAAPPEVHSALLGSGPGPGSLLSAATAWSALSIEYTSVAEELIAVLGAVQAGAWESPSAEQYAVAHVPYLMWLMRASTTSAQAAAQLEIVAAAYTTALAAMPTLAELAANHAIHAVLVATNFFGINAIPIALNEADYVRMWIQAATTMATYEAASGAAVAATPETTPAPEIVQDEHADEDGDGHDHGGESTPIDTVVAEVLRIVSGGRLNWDPAEGTLNGIPFEDYTNAADPNWWIARAIEFPKDFETFIQELFTNPEEALQSYFELLFFDYPEHIVQIVQALSQSPQLLAVALGAAASNLGAVIGLAGLSGLAAIQPAAVPAAIAPPAAAVPMLPVAGMAPSLVATAAAPAAPAPTTAALTSTVTGAGPAPPPALAAGGFGYPFLVGGGPGIGFGDAMSASASASAKNKAPEPDSAAATAAAAAREQARRRRRRRAGLRGYGDEYMDIEVDPDWGAPPDEEPVASTTVSDHGADNMGFAGTLQKESAAKVAGLTTLAADDFGSNPRMPLLPDTWDPDRDSPRS